MGTTSQNVNHKSCMSISLQIHDIVVVREKLGNYAMALDRHAVEKNEKISIYGG